MILQRKLALFLIAASLSVGSAFSQTFEAERVLIASTLDENGDPVLKAFRVDFEHGLTEVWRTLGGEPGRRNHIDAPIIADIDQDGQNELLGVDRHRVLMWKTPDPEPVIYEISNEPELGFSALAVGDLDNDGGMEVVAGLGKRLVVLRYEEGFKKVAEYVLPSFVHILSIKIGSVRSDGLNQLFVAGWSAKGDTAHAYSYMNPELKRIHTYSLWDDYSVIDGKVVKVGQILASNGYITSPAGRVQTLRLADIDGDGINEVVISGADHSAETGNGTLFPFAGVAAWKYEEKTDSYTKIAELENQWRLVTRDVELPMTIESRFESINRTIGMGPEAMNVGDIDGDGENEVIVVSIGSFLSYADPDAEKARVSILTYNRGRFVFRAHTEIPGAYAHFDGVAIGDLDGDGINEFTDSGRFVMKWDPKTGGFRRLDIPPLETNYTNYLVIGDLPFND